jgi:hypothetical protein
MHQNSEKCILHLCPSEAVTCSSETKQDRRMAPRSKLFVSVRLQEQRPNPEKSVLGLCPSEDDFCCLKAKHDNITESRPKFLFQQGDYSNKEQKPEN